MPRPFLKNLPVRRKLTLIALVTTGVALGFTFAGFVAHQAVTFRRDTIEEHIAVARMLADNTASALAFNDPDAATQTLRSVTAHPHVMAAILYDRDGRAFATFRPVHAPILQAPARAEGDGFRWGTNSFELFHPFSLAGEPVGTIYLRSDLSEMHESVAAFAMVSAVVLMAAGLAAYLMARRLQHLITTPVSHLAGVARTVAKERNYAVRATKQGNDELGSLVDTFNTMLDQIQHHEAALREARDQLEERVQDRTRALRQEVTDRKRAEQEVVREKARLQLIFESVPVGIAVERVEPTGERSRILNDAHLRICGLARAEAVASAFQKITHPDDYAHQALLRRKLDEGTIDRFSLEKRYLRTDGQIVWVTYSVQRERYSDGGWQDLSTIVDITEVKRAQEQSAREQARFKFIFDAVPVGITWMMHGDIGTRVVNPAHARITGIPAGNCHELARYKDATHPDDRGRQDALHQRLLAGEIDSYNVEKRYRHPDGAVRWTELSVRFYRGETSAETQEISTLVDITDRKLAETSLAETHKQLLDTSRQAGMAEVATGVLHNVGNVLNSVNVSATLLSDLVRQSKVGRVTKLADLFREQEATLGTFFAADPRAQQVPGFVQSLARHLHREQAELLRELESLRKNIEHIKDIVAMQQNYAKVSGVAESVAVTDLVEDALRMNTGALARHEVALTCEFNARPVITVEKHKVLQILVNLMRNAKYACDESGHAEKRMTVRVTADQARVRIAVIDNGVGIPPENLTRIFAHGFTTRKHGHGFGLHSGAIAARELGGSLCAQSEGPGRGAVFTLELPYQIEARAA